MAIFDEKIEIRERCKGVPVDSKTVQRSALCRSRRELSNAYLLAKIGVDTAENEPLEVWGENAIQYSLHSLVTTETAAQHAQEHFCADMRGKERSKSWMKNEEPLLHVSMRNTLHVFYTLRSRPHEVGAKSRSGAVAAAAATSDST